MSLARTLSRINSKDFSPKLAISVSQFFCSSTLFPRNLIFSVILIIMCLLLRTETTTNFRANISHKNESKRENITTVIVKENEIK